MTHPAGTKLGPYEVIALIGAGGMGEVYKANDSRLHRHVAVKVLPQSLATDPDRLRRFEQEARSAGAMNHPNVVAVYDVGLHEGAPYIVSELLHGETLRGKKERSVSQVARAVSGTSPKPRRVNPLAPQWGPSSPRPRRGSCR